MAFDTLIVDIKASTAGQWYKELDSRNRNIVQLAAAVLSVLFLIVFVWMPISAWSESEIQRYQNSMALNEWILENEPQARQLDDKNPASQGTKDSLLTLISRSAKSSGITLLRFQEEGSGGVSVVLQEQIFNDVIIWLEQLQTRNNIEIRQLSIDVHSTPGKVNARIIFI